MDAYEKKLEIIHYTPHQTLPSKNGCSSKNLASNHTCLFPVRPPTSGDDHCLPFCLILILWPWVMGIAYKGCVYNIPLLIINA